MKILFKIKDFDILNVHLARQLIDVNLIIYFDFKIDFGFLHNFILYLYNCIIGSKKNYYILPLLNQLFVNLLQIIFILNMLEFDLHLKK